MVIPNNLAGTEVHFRGIRRNCAWSLQQESCLSRGPYSQEHNGRRTDGQAIWGPPSFLRCQCSTYYWTFILVLIWQRWTWVVWTYNRWPPIWAIFPSCSPSSIHPSVRLSVHPSMHPLYLLREWGSLNILTTPLVGPKLVVCEWSSFRSALLVLSPALHLSQPCTSQ